MPWDSTRLWCAEVGADLAVGPARPVAGGPGESVTQPRWSPDGVLHYISDRSGWWNIYNEPGGPVPDRRRVRRTGLGVRQLHLRLRPRWAAGRGLGRDRRPAPRAAREGRAEPRDRVSSFSSAVTAGVQDPRVTAVVTPSPPPRSAPAVVRLDVAPAPSRSSAAAVRSRSIRGHLSRPRGHRVPDRRRPGRPRPVLPARPTRPRRAPGERPPVIVIIHGGPTSSTSPVLNLSVQYWTSRGFASPTSTTGGSTGYGRAYRQLLDGRWGIADVEDCAAVVGWLAEQGLVDGERAVIRGGSAGRLHHPGRAGVHRRLRGRRQPLRRRRPGAAGP